TALGTSRLLASCKLKWYKLASCLRPQPTESSKCPGYVVLMDATTVARENLDTIDTIVNNCCVLLELNSPERARVLITSELFSPLGFGYNSLAHIGTLDCSRTVSFDKIQDTCPVVSYKIGR